MISEYEKPLRRHPLRPVRWVDDGVLLLDQRRLPGEELYLHFSTSVEVADAIRNMVVRGAPAIGLAAAFGSVLAAMEADWSNGQSRQWLGRFRQLLQPLAKSRPTAVNLVWALEKMDQAAARLAAESGSPISPLRQLAEELLVADLADGQRMSDLGAALIEPGSAVLTHCNAGALATGGVGTALGVIKVAWQKGVVQQVYASETRPWFQGSRLTAWELQQHGVDPCLVVEGAVGALLRDQGINWLIVGADRIARNGDVANKVGTYGAAILAREHGVKVMVVAPTSTIDMTLPTGADIEIEQRNSEEVTVVSGVRIAADNVSVWNPVFDITPARLVDVIVTEKGVVEPPFLPAIEQLLR